jgi:hypothetical protein
MHSIARRCGYPLDSTRAMLVLACSAVSERLRLLAGSIYQHRRPTTSPPSPPPAAPAAGPGATRLGLCARCGSEPASVTAPGHRSWPGPLPPARTSPSRVAGWVLTERIASALLGRRAVRHRLLSWASAGLLAGVVDRRSALPQCSAQPVGWDLGEGVSFKFRAIATACGPPAGPTRTRRSTSVSQLRPPPGPGPWGRFASRSPPLR